MMPTRLGNVLKSAESRSRYLYGLDAVICWPRLWLVLPEATRQELVRARVDLDAGARAVLWSALFAIWAAWWPWAAVIALVVAAAAYRGTVSAAGLYGDLITAAFDVHRPQLYQALRWPLPKNPSEEKALGTALTKYLWRGSDEATPSFTGAEKGKAVDSWEGRIGMMGFSLRKIPHDAPADAQER
jgi:hypothetical protein